MSALPMINGGSGGIDYNTLQAMFHEMSICMDGTNNRGGATYNTVNNTDITISGTTSGGFNAPYGTAKYCTISCSKKGYYYAFGMAMGRGYSGANTAYVSLTIDGSTVTQGSSWSGIYYVNTSISTYEYCYLKSSGSGTFTPLGLSSGLIYLGEELDNLPT